MVGEINEDSGNKEGSDFSNLNADNFYKFDYSNLFRQDNNLVFDNQISRISEVKCDDIFSGFTEIPEEELFQRRFDPFPDNKDMEKLSAVEGGPSSKSIEQKEPKIHESEKITTYSEVKINSHDELTQQVEEVNKKKKLRTNLRNKEKTIDDHPEVDFRSRVRFSKVHDRGKFQKIFFV